MQALYALEVQLLQYLQLLVVQYAQQVVTVKSDLGESKTAKLVFTTQTLAKRLTSNALNARLELTAQEPHSQQLQAHASQVTIVMLSRLCQIRSQLHQDPTLLL
jgi:hypothetical protein